MSILRRTIVFRASKEAYELFNPLLEDTLNAYEFGINNPSNGIVALDFMPFSLYNLFLEMGKYMATDESGKKRVTEYILKSAGMKNVEEFLESYYKRKNALDELIKISKAQN